jgi:hypothetical protein
VILDGIFASQESQQADFASHALSPALEELGEKPAWQTFEDRGQKLTVFESPRLPRRNPTLKKRAHPEQGRPDRMILGAPRTGEPEAHPANDLLPIRTTALESSLENNRERNP